MAQILDRAYTGYSWCAPNAIELSGPAVPEGTWHGVCGGLGGGLHTS